MSYACDRCGKGVLVGRHVSHAKNRTRKLSLPNLHSFRGIFNGKLGKWRLCTKCLRTVKKQMKADEKADRSRKDKKQITAEKGMQRNAKAEEGR